jgi:hypothetical protein
MRFFSFRFQLAYAAMVGIPIMVIATIMKCEHGIVAPMAVHGEWKLELDSTSQNGCFDNTISRDGTWVISQSGKGFTINAGDSKREIARGQIQDHAFRAIIKTYPFEDKCFGSRLITVEGELSTDKTPQVLSGTFAVENCLDCGPAPFHATHISF